MSTTLNVNGKSLTVDVPDDTRLLWTLRDVLGMTGTKFGCGMALCGACTFHLDGVAMRACITPISATVGKKITTIAGAVGQTDAGQTRARHRRPLQLPVLRCRSHRGRGERLCRNR